MSELINNSERRKEILKELILELHSGTEPEIVKEQIQKLLKQIPYGEVVEVEQQLINEGLPVEEVTRLCDIHSSVLEGSIDLKSLKFIPKGHPIDTFKRENREIEKLVKEIRDKINNLNDTNDFLKQKNELSSLFNLLYDVDKHYKRKEFLLFPFLENYGITGPPKVMWAKDDEIRELIKSTIESIANCENIEDIKSIIPFLINPTLQQVEDMIIKEESILLPMSSDRLTELEWYKIYNESMDYGYCIIAPNIEWKPKIDLSKETEQNLQNSNDIRLDSGKLNIEELQNILNTLPFDLTFVDKNDKVKYFTEGSDRIFARSRAVLQRDVRMCHPPSSVHIVDKIIEDFKSGKEDRAPFWIQLHGKFIHIEYFAVRNKDGEYLGTLEVSQDLTKLRSLEGEQRLLNYERREKND